MCICTETKHSDNNIMTSMSVDNQIKKKQITKQNKFIFTVPTQPMKKV